MTVNSKQDIDLLFASVDALAKFDGSPPSPAEKNYRILYMGCPEFSLPPLRALVEAGYNVVAVATQPDRPVGRKQVVTPTCTKALAVELGLPVYQWERLDYVVMGKDLDMICPDLIITSAYGNILPREVLTYPQFACLNIHPSDLPRWRGASPVASAIMAGDSVTALSLIRMEEGLDDGAIVAKCKYPIDDKIDTVQLSLELAELSAKLLLKTLPYWYRGLVRSHPQTEALATYAKKLCKEDGLLDFTQTARENADKVRALSAWPGAYTFYRGKRYKIYEAELIKKQASEVPGSVVRRDRDLLVACQDAYLSLKIIQGSGGHRLPADVCYHNFAEGSLFCSTDD